MENKSYINTLLEGFATMADQLAFSLYDGKQVTNVSRSAFLEDILRTAGSLEVRGKHIALIAPNSYRWLVSFLAIAATGNTAVLLNPALPLDMLADQCRHTDVSLVLGSSPSPEFPALSLSPEAAPLSLDALPCPPVDDTAVLMFTSGTTGKSKAVELSWGNITAAIAHPEGFFSGPGLERPMLVLPMYHIAGLRGALSLLSRGKTLCMGRGAMHLLMDMPVLAPTQVQLVPAMVESLYKLLRRTTTVEQRQKYTGPNLQRIVIGGADAKLSVCRSLMDMGYTIESGYAMTETGGVGTWGIWDKNHINTIGRPSGDMECRIENGEILLRGPSQMKGYYRDPEASAQVVREGWIHTGDLGYRSDDGWFYLTGRKKNVIILSGGENVSPEELEEQLSRCDAIEECLVYSDGKGICAQIYSRDSQAAADHIRAFNREQPLYRQIYKVNFSADPLPKNGSGKLIRKEEPHGQ